MFLPVEVPQTDRFAMSSDRRTFHDVGRGAGCPAAPRFRRRSLARQPDRTDLRVRILVARANLGRIEHLGVNDATDTERRAPSRVNWLVGAEGCEHERPSQRQCAHDGVEPRVTHDGVHAREQERLRDVLLDMDVRWQRSERRRVDGPADGDDQIDGLVDQRVEERAERALAIEDVARVR